MIPKRSWSSLFDDEATGPSLVSMDSTPAPSPEVTHVSTLPSTEEIFSFESLAITRKGPHKQATPIVDSSVHRCTRGSIKRDGFKPVLQELLMDVPKQRKTKPSPCRF
ncbi:hypothetical protein D1007_31752 [Hordeum vulgare]|nr:hypothetical protein D1007_31752 [Hordeum vulgare]